MNDHNNSPRVIVWLMGASIVSLAGVIGVAVVLCGGG